MAEVTVKGLSELGEALKQFPVVLGQKYLRRATYSAAAVIEADAISRVPVRTGALRDHIAIFNRRADGDTAAYAIGVRGIRLNRKAKKVLRILRRANNVQRISVAGDVYYWRFIEFGTAKMTAKPFLRPAFEAQKQNALDVFKTILADGVIAAEQEASK